MKIQTENLNFVISCAKPGTDHAWPLLQSSCNMGSLLSMLSAPTHGYQVTAPLPIRSVAWLDHVADLTSLYGAHTNVCVLRRSADEDVDRFVDTSLCAHEFERALRLPSAHLNVHELIPESTDQRSASAFLEDVRWLAQVYADLTGAEQIGLRLASTHQPLCPRFHVDRVGVRLVCTYSGPGTEFVDHTDVNREWLGHRAGSKRDEETGLLRTSQAVQRMQRFDIGLLKGEAWPDNEGRGAVHRSPVVPVSSPRRVFLSIEGL